MPRLGEIVLSEKLLTSRELEKALENHVLHGVKLGTCLVEMGLVKDDDLARCLGKQTGHSFMSKEQLMLLGSQNLAILTPAAIKKHRLIPVGISGIALKIATDHEPSQKKLLELEQLLGRKLEPVMVSGYAVDCFLEKMFGIQRPGRFLPKHIRQKPVTTTAAKTADNQQKTSLVIDGVEWKNLDDVTKDEEYTQKFNSQYDIGIETSSLALSDLSRRLSHATSRDDVAKYSLEYLADSRKTAALLIIKETTAQGWSAITDRKKLSAFKDIQFSISAIPDLKECVSTQRPVLGETYTTETRSLLKAISHDSCDLAYFPISIQQHVVAVLLCDRSDPFNLEETTELSRKISYALAILILRSKLLR